MSQYDALAFSYDRLTQDVPYEKVLEFYEALLSQVGAKPRTVVDLGCGTGSMAALLAGKGYAVTGVDLSEEMLTQAWEKCMDLPNPPMFVCQSMAELELPEQVDWILSCLDSLNYVTDPRDCCETLGRAYKSLNPGGVLLFDVNTPEKLRAMDGQVFLDEDEDVYCVWRGEFDEDENICYYGMDLFQRRGDLWERSFEEHLEYAYSLEELTKYLRQAGFSRIDLFGDLRMEPPRAGEQRVFFRAVKDA